MRNLLAMAEGKGIFDALVGVGNSAGGWEGDLFGIDPLFFGILVALNLQTSFLTPPMAMSAYYLKGIAPPEVKLTDIFSGVMPFLLMVFMAMALMYIWPDIVFVLPRMIYGS